MDKSNFRLIIDQRSLTRTVPSFAKPSYGKIPGIIRPQERLIHAFVPGSPSIGVWHREGHRIETVEPLPLRVSVNRDTLMPEISAAWFEETLLDIEQVTMVNIAREISSRHRQLIDSTALRDTGVLIIGAGTVGSLAALQLVQLGISRFTLIDRDVVEASNLSRSSYGFSDIGRAKVLALAGHLQRVNPGIFVDAIHSDVNRIAVDTWRDVVAKSSIALIAIDDVRAQMRLSDQLSRQIPVVVSVIQEGATTGEITFVTHETKHFCCVTNINERLHAAPNGVSGAQGLISDVQIVVAETVNIMMHVLQPGCARFPNPLNPQTNVILVGRGDAAGVLAANLNRSGPLSSVSVDTSARPTPCGFCAVSSTQERR